MSGKSEQGRVSEWRWRGPHLIHIMQDDLADKGVVAGMLDSQLDILGDNLVDVNRTGGHTQARMSDWALCRLLLAEQKTDCCVLEVEDGGVPDVGSCEGQVDVRQNVTSVVGEGHRHRHRAIDPEVTSHLPKEVKEE